MMVVMAIIGLMALIAIPTVSGYFQVSLESAARDLSRVVKDTYNTTVVTGQIHRIVYDFKARSYWVETCPYDTLLDTAESKKREERKRRLSFGKDDKDKEASPCAMDKVVTRKKIELPLGVEFEDVKSQQAEEPITEGKATTHFFAQGLIEPTIVHLKDGSKHHASLVFAPIVGKTDLYERYVTEKELADAKK